MRYSYLNTNTHRLEIANMENALLIHIVEQLKDPLIEEWRRFSQDIIDKAIKELRACVRENGGHFEHKL